MIDLLQQAKPIKLLICDVDGVFTNGQLIFDSKGECLKTFHVQDGLGVKLLIQQGIAVSAITNRYSAIVENRLSALGVSPIYDANNNKLALFKQLAQTRQLDYHTIAYVGDDLVDLACLKQAGLSIAVANACPEVKQQAHWVTEKQGGSGAVREIAEFLLKVQNKWQQAIAAFTDSY